MVTVCRPDRVCVGFAGRDCPHIALDPPPSNWCRGRGSFKMAESSTGPALGLHGDDRGGMARIGLALSMSPESALR